MVDLSAGAIEPILILAAVLALVSILVSKVSGRIGVPALLIFLLVGMLAGSEGPGGIYFDDYRLAEAVGVVCLALILYAGGLDTRYAAVRPVLREGVLLSTLGVLLTAIGIGAVVAAATDLDWKQGLLLGAIVSSTDAAAVFAVLDARSVRLRPRVRALLELESGSNDPMAVFLTLGFVQLVMEPDATVASLLPLFVQQMALGFVLGYGFARLLVYAINRIRLEYDGLYPVLSLALVAATYGVTSVLGGNGFLAVYVAGIVAGNSVLIHRRSLGRFHDGLAWLAQITMFLTLGLLVFPSHIVPVMGVGLLVTLVLIVVARPAAVFLVLAFSRLRARERGFVAWVGLRGAVPIVLGIFPLLAGVPGAEDLFNIVFFVVLGSALVQGTSVPFVARLLRVDDSDLAAPPALGSAPEGAGRIAEFEVAETAPVVGRQLAEAGLPDAALVLLIRRDRSYVVPTGAMKLQAGDVLLVLLDEQSAARLVRELGLVRQHTRFLTRPAASARDAGV